MGSRISLTKIEARLWDEIVIDGDVMYYWMVQAREKNIHGQVVGQHEHNGSSRIFLTAFNEMMASIMQYRSGSMIK